MKITLYIKPEIIANMFTSAIESGDPVTTASRGGWCEGIYLATPNAEKNVEELEEAGDPWYSVTKIYEGNYPLLVRIAEVDNETTGHITNHVISLSNIQKGLQVMAEKYPHIFAQILEDNTDAPCADIFLQCMLFGEEKYA